LLVSENHELHADAKATFTIARHAAADLTQSFYLTPKSPHRDRLSKKDLGELKKALKKSAFALKEGPQSEEKLLYLRKLYESHIQALSDFFIMSITPFVSEEKIEEAWRKNI
jgi:hypothetical protein